ncbi:hypothetical protein [Streptomyces qinzhouensis]|uniref:Integral membrane protein n=1 Tax=Streptomyces qinzhouensis TaxID=2599401 RepID=A0A5B8JTC3_9ACTN|nr:hypothetical protein [Streptomyces qinzhouensis]QDY81153.1 hypothetical protein FQU76_19205 [Streptomyces qinzhouensis]
MRAGSGLRLAHTAVLAAVCVVVSGAGHAVASGASPPPAAYGIALPPICLLAWRLTRKERSAGVVVSVSAAAQVLLHLLFGAVPHGAAGSGGSGGAGGSGGVCAAHHGPGHGMPSGAAGELPGPVADRLPGPGSGMPSGTAGDTMSGWLSGIAGDTVSGWLSGIASGVTSGLSGVNSGMTVAHLVAGAVSGWWLWRGERAVAQLSLALRLFLRGRLRLVRTVLRGAYVLLPPEGVRPPRPRRYRVRLPESLLLLRAVTRRGPPLLPS